MHKKSRRNYNWINVAIFCFLLRLSYQLVAPPGIIMVLLPICSAVFFLSRFFYIFFYWQCFYHIQFYVHKLMNLIKLLNYFIFILGCVIFRSGSSSIIQFATLCLFLYFLFRSYGRFVLVS